MISTSELEFQYTRNAPVFAFPDLHVDKSAQCLLLGESGSGKTTFLHLLAGLLTPRKGTVTIDGVVMSGLAGSSLDRFRGQHVGFVFQRNHLVAALTVEQNLLLAPYLADMVSDKEKVKALLIELGLEDKMHSKVQDLSQGQMQRVAIARAVLNNPKVILADEPTSALDDRNCDRVIELLIKVSKKYSAALVIATHDQRLKSVMSNQINVSVSK